MFLAKSRREIRVTRDCARSLLEVQETNHADKSEARPFERRITQAQLAKGISRTPAHVSRLIRGHLRLRACDRRRIASFLGVSEAQLFPSRKRSTRSTARPESDRSAREGPGDA